MKPAFFKRMIIIISAPESKRRLNLNSLCLTKKQSENTIGRRKPKNGLQIFFQFFYTNITYTKKDL